MSIVDDPKFTQLKISGRLPTPKGIALEVINLTQQDDASNHDIARLIGADPALSGRIIKAANILLSNSTRPVVTIVDAVAVLGMRGLRQLVLGIALIVDHRHGPCKQFNYQHFWMHSLLTGIAARHLAERSRLAAAEEIFVVALLENIGQLVLATIFADEYGKLLKEAASLSLSDIYQQETQKFGFNEAELSEAVLADLGFPKIFQSLVRDSAQPETARATEGSREWRLLHLLHISGLIAEVCLSVPENQTQLLTRLKLDAAKAGIETEDLIAVGDASARDWQEWSALLGMGKLDLQSFTELLTAQKCLTESVVAANSKPSEPSDFKLRVLVVEDDPTMMVLLESMLKTAGHTVVTARDGVEALKAVSQHKPQLIISDWLMPKMDGIALCKKLRETEEGRSIYVIILTSQQNPEKLVEAFDAGADDYLVKPITPKIFFARLKAGQRLVHLQNTQAIDREQLLRLSNDLAATNEQLQQLALTDALTGLPNRRSAMEHLEREWALTERGNRALACMMIDVDHFKAINDKFGHPVGDIALQHAANELRQAARAQDVVCRMGGEEFLVICPDTDIAEAHQAAERLRKRIEAMRINSIEPPLAMTISIGISNKNAATNVLEKLLTDADKCLYQAKHAGRNRSVY